LNRNVEYAAARRFWLRRYYNKNHNNKFDASRFGWKRILDAAAASIEKCARDIDVPDTRAFT